LLATHYGKISDSVSREKKMFNPVGVDTIKAHQQSLQQVQQLLPSIRAVSKTTPSASIRGTDELPLDREPHEKVEIHSVTNYDPWLKHLYRLWQKQLTQHYSPLANMPNPNPHVHWTPDMTATYIHELAMRYLGWLAYYKKWKLLDAMIVLTQQWELTWREGLVELGDAQSSLAVKDVLVNTAGMFHKHWLDTCVKMIEDHDHPTVPKV
jgi:hypothetical protein